MYAYEDIFSATGRSAAPPSAGVGPSGTVVMPGGVASSPRGGGGGWTPVKIGLIAVGLVIGLMVVVSLFHRARSQRQMAWQAQAASDAAAAGLAQRVLRRSEA